MASSHSAIYISDWFQTRTFFPIHFIAAKINRQKLKLTWNWMKLNFSPSNISNPLAAEKENWRKNRLCHQNRFYIIDVYWSRSRGWEKKNFCSRKQRALSRKIWCSRFEIGNAISRVVVCAKRGRKKRHRINRAGANTLMRVIYKTAVCASVTLMCTPSVQAVTVSSSRGFVSNGIQKSCWVKSARGEVRHKRRSAQYFDNIRPLAEATASVGIDSWVDPSETEKLGKK